MYLDDSLKFVVNARSRLAVHLAAPEGRNITRQAEQTMGGRAVALSRNNGTHQGVCIQIVTTVEEQHLPA